MFSCAVRICSSVPRSPHRKGLPITGKHQRTIREGRICHNKCVPQPRKNLGKLRCRAWYLQSAGHCEAHNSSAANLSSISRRHTA